VQEDRPDRPGVIARPPLILAATIALGLVLNFFWPASFSPPAIAAPLGVLIILGGIALGISAVKEMQAVNTSFEINKPSTEIVTSGSFKGATIRFIWGCFFFIPALLFSQIRYGF
jgi:protein-S-isoprenylcysteine O-methyltransferase Ste14